MISLVPSESWGTLSGCGLLPENGVRGHAPPGAFGRAAASPQTRQMRCWPSSERTTNPSSRRKRQDSLSLSLVLFPPKPLRWVSAGTLLGEVIRHSRFAFFRHFYVGGGITTLGVRFMLSKRWMPTGHGGLFAAFMPPRYSPRVGRIFPRRVHTPPQPPTAHTAAHRAKHGAFSPPETAAGSIGSTAWVP